MTSSINKDYGFSVSHDGPMIEGLFKGSHNDEDRIMFHLHFPHNPLFIDDTEDGKTVTLHISPGAPLTEFISFLEEIVTTYKKYTKEGSRTSDMDIESTNISILVSEAMKLARITIKGKESIFVPTEYLEELRDLLNDYFQITN